MNVIAGRLNFRLGKNLYCHKGDDNLFIGHSRGHTSISFTKPLMINFISLLESSVNNKKYCELCIPAFDSERPFISFVALEAEDEGYRNINIAGGGFYLTINVRVKVIPNLILFLKKEWNV